MTHVTSDPGAGVSYIYVDETLDVVNTTRMQTKNNTIVHADWDVDGNLAGIEILE